MCTRFAPVNNRVVSTIAAVLTYEPARAEISTEYVYVERYNRHTAPTQPTQTYEDQRPTDSLS
jgi:hypothetical protein